MLPSAGADQEDGQMKLRALAAAVACGWAFGVAATTGVATADDDPLPSCNWHPAPCYSEFEQRNVGVPEAPSSQPPPPADGAPDLAAGDGPCAADRLDADRPPWCPSRENMEKYYNGGLAPCAPERLFRPDWCPSPEDMTRWFPNA
ncbi:hypothetical protein JNN96_10050 [Mycobacterium sp. DSM 3803]|nr:hypothetical protein [Mycobacterium sp. DSM 3803]